MSTAKVSSKGQITLPAAARRKLGIAPHSTVEVITRDDGIVIRPLRSVMELAGVLRPYSRGKVMDWEAARTETERAVAREVAHE